MEKVTEDSLRLKKDITKQIFIIGSSPARSQTVSRENAGREKGHDRRQEMI